MSRAHRFITHGQDLVCGLVMAAMTVLAGCANQEINRPSTVDRWSGRLALVVASDPPQQYHAAFELDGNPESGQLDLFSPLGNMLASLQWQPGQALLRQGARIDAYESVNALASAATGTAVPVRALFLWLRGSPEAVDGWVVDLSQLSVGRLHAHRQSPLPEADLRIIVDLQ